MKIEDAYDNWSGHYDSVTNLTRDLEACALRRTLAGIAKCRVLEIGCGTGKNSEWLADKATLLIGVDLSAAMLARAKVKVTNPSARFLKADITKEWAFVENEQFDLITFSLVLEHIEDLDFVFSQAAPKLAQNGVIYIGELHPFKQYTGSKARFATPVGETVLDCYTHHISDFISAAKRQGLKINDVEDWFDNNDRAGIPRILTLTFKKEKGEC